MKSFRLALCAALCATSLLTSCGGGGQTATTPDATPTPEAPAPDPDPAPSLPDLTKDPISDRSVSGVVVTTDELPLPGVAVIADAISTTSDAGGEFALEGLPTSAVTLTLAAPGFMPTSTTIAAGGDVTDLEFTLEPFPVSGLGPVEIAVRPGLGGANLAITLPGVLLPVDVFIYRREATGDYDWTAPINNTPLRQVEIIPGGQAASAVPGPELNFRDPNIVGGLDYAYTVRLQDRSGEFGPPSDEVPVKAAGFGPATILTPGPDEALLDTTPGADGSLVALYRDLTYQPWHRFIARRLDGTGASEEIFTSQGVYDDARIYVDRFDTPYFLYRRNGIEFLFETFLFNSYDSYGLSPDIHLGESYRKATDELAGDMLFRPDTNGDSPQELLGVYLNRDQQIVANIWNFGGRPRDLQLTLGSITGQKPNLQSCINSEGDLLAIWNADYSDSSYYRMAFVDNTTLIPDRYLASGSGMAVRLGVTADDQFLVAYTTTPNATTIKLHRYLANGNPTADTEIDLAAENVSLLSQHQRIAIATLPNGRTYLAAIVTTSTGGTELRAWDLTNIEEIESLGQIAFTANAPTPSSMEVTTDYAGHTHLVATENGQTVYRQLFWPAN